MSEGPRRIVRRAAVAAYVIAGAGLAAMVTIILFFAIRQPWGTLNDIALLVMTAAIPLLMLAFWELGGLTPTPIALVAQVSGWIAVHPLIYAGGVGYSIAFPVWAYLMGRHLTALA